MKILIVNNAEKNVSEFVSPIEKILTEANTGSDTIGYSDAPNTGLDDYDGIILSASPSGDDIVEHHIQYYSWVKTSNKPIFGICAGHQIIGVLFGSKLLRNIESEAGNFFVTIDRADPIFNGCKGKFLARQKHKDSITLPKDFTSLAQSKNCKVQVMKHKSKPIYTTQFHAEALNKKIILNFLELIKIISL